MLGGRRKGQRDEAREMRGSLFCYVWYMLGIFFSGVLLQGPVTRKNAAPTFLCFDRRAVAAKTKTNSPRLDCYFGRRLVLPQLHHGFSLGTSSVTRWNPKHRGTAHNRYQRDEFSLRNPKKQARRCRKQERREKKEKTGIVPPIRGVPVNFW